MGNTIPVGVAYQDPDLKAVSVTALTIGTTAVTATAAELNALHGATATAAEISTLHDEIASVTTTATPASGSCGVQFVFKNGAGATIGTPIRSMICYVSTVAGVQSAAATSLAVLTNGGLITLVTGQVALVSTTTAGLLGVTLTAGGGTSPTGDFYLTFVLPNGGIVTSTLIHCTA